MKEPNKEVSYEEAMELRKQSVEKMRGELEMLKVEHEYYQLITEIEMANFNRMQIQIQKAEIMFNTQKQSQLEPQEKELKSRMEVSRED